MGDAEIQHPQAPLSLWRQRVGWRPPYRFSTTLLTPTNLIPLLQVVLFIASLHKQASEAQFYSVHCLEPMRSILRHIQGYLRCAFPQVGKAESLWSTSLFLHQPVVQGNQNVYVPILVALHVDLHAHMGPYYLPFPPPSHLKDVRWALSNRQQASRHNRYVASRFMPFVLAVWPSCEIVIYSALRVDLRRAPHYYSLRLSCGTLGERFCLAAHQ